MDKIVIERAALSDAQLFYDARFNDVANTYSRTKIIPEYAEHLVWYRANYLDNFFIIILNGSKIGYVRMNTHNEVSIAIRPNHQNKGYATKALKIFTWQFENLNATIYKSNIASRRLFSKFPVILVKLIEDD